MFEVAVFVVAVLSGATASVVGFGIGSLMTPLLAARYGTPVAVAAVAIPHAVASIVRGWRLRASIDWHVVRTFGILSAAGGLAGALLYSRLGNRALTIALACLLLLTASAGLTGWSRRWHPKGPLVWMLGLVSGFFGGIAGNQGSVRAAALSSFSLTPLAFVATSTAIAVCVDIARTPVYVWKAGSDLVPLTRLLVVASIGVLIGTLFGERLLKSLSPETFRLVVHATIGALGIWLLLRALSSAP